MDIDDGSSTNYSGQSPKHASEKRRNSDVNTCRKDIKEKEVPKELDMSKGILLMGNNSSAIWITNGLLCIVMYYKTVKSSELTMKKPERSQKTWAMVISLCTAYTSESMVNAVNLYLNFYIVILICLLQSIYILN